MKELSAYCINEDGLLVYSGLPVGVNDLRVEHFNGEYYSKWREKFYKGMPPCQYEIVSIIQVDTTQCNYDYYSHFDINLQFTHGFVAADRLKINYLLIGNCYRQI